MFFFFFLKKITFTGKTAQKINKDKTRSNGPLFTQIRQGSVKEPFKVCENWLSVTVTGVEAENLHT